MIKEEFLYLIAALKSNYRNFGVESKEQMKFWFEMLKDLDYVLAETAVKKLISTSTYSPTIADIRKAASETKQELPDAAEAWGEVTKAIQKYGSYRQDDAMNSMSETTRKVVNSIGWRELCYSENQMADRAHFIKLYNTAIDRIEKDRVLPPDVKLNMVQIQQNQQRLNEGIAMLVERKEL